MYSKFGHQKSTTINHRKINQLCIDSCTICIKICGKALIGEDLVVKDKFDNPTDNFAFQVLKGNDTVGQFGL